MMIKGKKEKLKLDCVSDLLRNDILSGKLPEGSKLPRGTELAELFHVSHISVRSAVKKLVREGYLESIHGRGTFVRSREPDKCRKVKLLVLQFMQEKLENPYIYILPEFFRRCQEREVQTDVISLNFLNRSNEDKMLETFRKSNYFGVLLAENNFNGNEPELRILRQLGLPVLLPHGVFLDVKNTGFEVMYYDVKSSWKHGLAHLASLGHRRIGVVNMKSQYGSRVAPETHQAFLKRFGLDLNPELVVASAFDPEAVKQAVMRLLSLPEPPSAIFCFSDYFAIYVYDALRQMNMEIPRDISVLGFCGYPGGYCMTPPLSTIDLQYSMIGCQAANRLIDGEVRMNPRGIRTPGKLVSRASTAVFTGREFLSK